MVWVDASCAEAWSTAPTTFSIRRLAKSLLVRIPAFTFHKLCSVEKKRGGDITASTIGRFFNG
jgi:hypothetical protein